MLYSIYLYINALNMQLYRLGFWDQAFLFIPPNIDNVGFHQFHSNKSQKKLVWSNN